MTLGQRNALLLVLVIVIAGIPALMALGVLPPLVADPQWAGGDGIIQDTVGEIQEGYEPWINPIFSPADLGIEPVMFGLQAFLGALLAAGFLGWLVGRRDAASGTDSGARRTAMIVSAIAIVVGALLLMVQTELGELQAFLAALQGIALGTLGFFIGYPMGRNAASTTTARSGARA